MITILQVVASVFEFFNKIATRIREIRIERAIKRKISDEAKRNLPKHEREILAKLKKKYGGRRPPPDW